ncbi:MAG: radical SAM protein [Anaerolineae bacterium]
MKWAYIARAREVLAGEEGAVVKDWGGKLPVALVYPNTYHVGMSSLGYQAVYRLLNARRDVACERAFWTRRFAGDDPVVSIESQQALADFAVIAFSISYELDYPHVVEVLRQAGVPLRADERDASWPAVIAGGPAVSANPLPVADFLDGVLIGEVEEQADALVDALWSGIDAPRPALWEALARVPGVYAPQLAPQDAAPVRRQWVRDVDPYPTSTVVYTRDTEFGDMQLIEIARGCGRGCRFCMAGYLTRPKREHSVASILDEAREGLAHRDRVGLVGAAVSDYSQIDELVGSLRGMGARISVSSLRVDPLSEALLGALAESGTETLTMAPEAGSERLRRTIHKGVTESDLFHAAERAEAYHFRQLKLYFMLGLPTETGADVDAIADLCGAVADRFSRQVTANVTPFVPKAHTPFQWAEMAPRAAMEARYNALQRSLGQMGIEVRGESAQWAEIQGLLARGDRRLGAVLADLRGSSIRAWEQAMAAHEVEPEAYLGARKPGEALPWGFIESGVGPRALTAEWERACAESKDVPGP